MRAKQARRIASALKASAHSAMALAVDAAGKRRTCDALAFWVSAFAQAVAQGATEAIARRLEAEEARAPEAMATGPADDGDDAPALDTVADKTGPLVETFGPGPHRFVALPGSTRGRVVRGGDA
jgi:hypothetical protein